MIVVVAAVVDQGGSVLLTRRLEGTHLGGLWEFPGGKIEEGETHAQGLVRELREELGVNAEVGDLVLSTSHHDADRSVALYFYRCRLTGTPAPRLGQQMRWVPRAELPSLEFPPADEALIRLLTESP